jgi:hypothetical protein
LSCDTLDSPSFPVPAALIPALQKAESFPAHTVAVTMEGKVVMQAEYTLHIHSLPLQLVPVIVVT